jgi:hypothetical protein
MQPAGVVFYYGGVFAFKVQHVRHLLLEAGSVVLYLFCGHHAAHVRFAGRVADVCRAAAEQHYRPVARALHMRHGHQRNIVTDVQTIRRGVEADVEGQLLFAHQFPELFRMGTLLNKAAFLKYVVCVSHFSLLKNMLFAYYFEFIAKPFAQKRTQPIAAVLIKPGLVHYQCKRLVRIKIKAVVRFVCTEKLIVIIALLMPVYAHSYAGITEAVFVPEIDERRTVKLPRRRYIEEIISPAQPSHARDAHGKKDISSGGHGIHGSGQRYCEKHKEHGMRTPSDGLEHARVKTLKVQHGLFCIYCCVHYISQCLILLLKAWG